MRRWSEASPVQLLSVMPGLVPGIHVFEAAKEVVDGRDKPGHDEIYPRAPIS
jgi:hypothetical protein